MQIHLHEVKILQIHNARPEFVKKKKNITAINQSESSILIQGVINIYTIKSGKSFRSDRGKKTSTSKVKDPLTFEIWIYKSINFCNLWGKKYTRPS